MVKDELYTYKTYDVYT